jgi:hypothetical protein
MWSTLSSTPRRLGSRRSWPDVAAYTTTQDGNWADTATWGGSGVPGNGDTATIAAGHDVTVDVDTIVGTSPVASTAVLTLAASTSTLTIASGVTLTVRGDCSVTGTTSRTTQITLNSGATYKFDSSLAASPSTTAYRMVLGLGNTQHVVLQCRGTPSSPCTITSETASSAAGGFIHDNANTGTANIDAEWTNFTKLGSSSANGINHGAGHANSLLRLVDCTIDDCGRLGTTFNHADAASFTLQSVRVTNSRTTTSLRYVTASTTPTGTRLIRGCAFDKQVQLQSPAGLTIEDTYFAADVDTTVGNAAATVRRCLIRDPDQGTWNINNSLTDCYILEDHTNTNPHGQQLLPARDITQSGCIIEWTGTGAGDGDFFVHATNPAAPRTHTCRRNILLPGGGDTNNAGKLVSLLGGANATVDAADNNTVFAATTSVDCGVVGYGETYAGRAGYVGSVRSNIVWNNVGGVGYKILQTTSTTTPTDCVTAADYNCGHNLAAGSEGKSYHKRNMTAAMFTASTPGGNDVDVNPLFVDPTRNLRRWGASRGAAGTVAASLALIASNPYLIRELIEWVRAGFEPRNRRLHNAGHNNATIGAVEFTPVNRRTMRRAS